MCVEGSQERALALHHLQPGSQGPGAHSGQPGAAPRAGPRPGDGPRLLEGGAGLLQRGAGRVSVCLLPGPPVRADREQWGRVQHHGGPHLQPPPQLEGRHQPHHHQVQSARQITAILCCRAREDRASVHAFDGKGLRALELLAVSLLIVGDVSWAVYNRYSNTTTHTSYVAHLTGAGLGLMVGFLVLRNRYVEPWEKNLKVVI